jgi:predicted O-linked N-acetylglucosamine transferase (SPINDLY family)
MLIGVLRRLLAERKLERGLAEARRRVEAGELESAESLCAELRESAWGDRAAELDDLQGTIALRARRHDAAVRHLRDAIARRDADPELHMRLAEAYGALPDPRNEAAQLGCALEHLPDGDPRRAGLMLRLAGALYECNELAEAERWYRRLLEKEPDHRDALLCLAVLREPADVEEARTLMDRHIALHEDAAARLRRALMLPAILQSEDEIEHVRQRLDRDLDELLAGRWPAIRHPEYEIGATAFALAYHGRNDRDLLAKLGRACRAVYPARTEPVAGRRGAGRLRVGFVSTYFHSHSIARTHSGFIAGLARDRFEVYVFAIAPKDDDWAKVIRMSAEHYVALPRDLDRVREAIDAAGLDILFYADIGMDPHTYFLAFWRLAPIQLVSWGHPVTTGIDTIDYFVSAEGLEPRGSEDQYSEALVRLPGYFMPRYRRPTVAAPAQARAQLGVSADRRLYCCLQNLFKLHPEFDLALKGILEGDAGGEIVLLESSPRSWMDQLRRRLEGALGAHAARVRFVPRMAQEAYQRFVAAADVVLDPFHFGGANSSCEPLALGVPIVTLPAFQLRGRFTLGMYEEMGLAECVARSPEEYVAIALRLAREPAYREEVSGRIAARCERLFDRPEAGRALGEALARLAESAR